MTQDMQNVSLLQNINIERVIFLYQLLVCIAIFDQLGLSEPAWGKKKGCTISVRTSSSESTPKRRMAEGRGVCGPGPRLGRLLSAALEEVIEGRVNNDRADLLAWAGTQKR